MIHVLWHVDEASKCNFDLFPNSFRKLCHTADLLAGSAPLQAMGNHIPSLESPFVAFFASSSAPSFSWTPVWPGIHLSSTFRPLCFHNAAHIHSCTPSTRW